MEPPFDFVSLAAARDVFSCCWVYVCVQLFSAGCYLLSHLSRAFLSSFDAASATAVFHLGGVQMVIAAMRAFPREDVQVRFDGESGS